MTAKIRRCETTLMTLGLAVIAFGVWNVMKMVIRFLLDYSDSSAAASDVDAESARFTMIFVFVVAIVVVSIDAALRIAIGILARKEGRGKEVGVLYLVLSVIAVAISAVMFVFDIQSAPGDANQFIDIVADVMIDTTSAVTLVALIVTSIKLKTLKKRIGEKEGG